MFILEYNKAYKRGLTITKIEIRGIGYEEFRKAENRGYFRHALTDFPNRIVLQIGKSKYASKIGLVTKINPSTGERIGPIRRLEVALEGKEWAVKLE